jgi:hypothetical protein
MIELAHYKSLKSRYRIDELFMVLRLAQEFFYMESSPLPVKPEGLQNLGLCSALRAFEQGGIFFVPHLL